MRTMIVYFIALLAIPVVLLGLTGLLALVARRVIPGLCLEGNSGRHGGPYPNPPQPNIAASTPAERP